MSDLEMSAARPSSRHRTTHSPLLAAVARFLARRGVERRRRQLAQETLHELERLDAATLVDIGVLRTARRATWIDMGRGMSPRLDVDFVYETRPPHPPLNALNLWGEDWRS